MLHLEGINEEFLLNFPGPVSIEWLLQQLLICNGTSGIQSFDQVDSPEEKILELEMDGFQYILTRKWTESTIEKYRLSPREQEIVSLVAKGFPNKSIASILNISPSTVATHIRRIFDKLNAKSRAEMVARVLERKLY